MTKPGIVTEHLIGLIAKQVNDNGLVVCMTRMARIRQLCQR